MSKTGMNVKYKVRREEKDNSRRKEQLDQRYVDVRNVLH